MNAPNDDDAIAAKRRRLAATAARVTVLRTRYDVLMNAFKFDAARALHDDIEEAQREYRELAATLPQPTPPAAAQIPYRVARRRRRR